MEKTSENLMYDLEQKRMTITAEEFHYALSALKKTIKNECVELVKSAIYHIENHN